MAAPRCTGLLAAVMLAGCATNLVEVGPSGSGIAVAVDGEPFARVRPDAPRGPAVWPLYAPGGVNVLRGFPFVTGGPEATDHEHHTGLWFAHGSVEGLDFWQGTGRIVAVGPAERQADGSVVVACAWRAPDGRTVADERRRFTFHAGDGWRAVDLGVELTGHAGAPLRFGDTKEGSLALRLAAPFCLEGPGAAGTLFDSEGRRGAQVWGQRARWIAYQATVGGDLVTVALLDHPRNLRHPTTWHARGYGLAAANPFGLADFQNLAKGSGDLLVPANAVFTMVVRVYLQRGPCDAAALDACWTAFAAEIRHGG